MKSMTGFGRAEASDKAYQVSVDVSSVNRKQLDIRFSTPKEALFLEPLVRSIVPDFVSRGTINVQIKINFTAGSGHQVKFNNKLIKEYLSHIKNLQEDSGIDANVSITDILSLPGAVENVEAELSIDELSQVVETSLKMALKNLVQARSIEGRHLKEDLTSRKDTLLRHLLILKEKKAATVTQFRQKLLSRIQEAELEIDLNSDRLHQEVVIYADRTDITEELVRLEAHLQQLDRLIDKTEPVGRELDFLMQELNREINTVAAKSLDSNIALLVVAMKAELERCREQIQNVE